MFLALPKYLFWAFSHPCQLPWPCVVHPTCASAHVGDALVAQVPGNIRRAEHFCVFLKRFIEYLRQRMSVQAVEQEKPTTFMTSLQTRMDIDGAPAACRPSLAVWQRRAVLGVLLVLRWYLGLFCTKINSLAMSGGTGALCCAHSNTYCMSAGDCPGNCDSEQNCASCRR